MLRKRYYILFVARDEDGRVKKIPLPLQYVYGFVAAALVGAFTIVGLAGSYTRMLLKTERFNQVRQDNQNLRNDYKQLAQVAHDRDVQVASLGALASEVTALYGLRQHKVIPAKESATAPTPATLAVKDDLTAADVKMTFEQFNALRDQAMSGRMTRALEGGSGARLRRRLDAVCRCTLHLACGRPRWIELRSARRSHQRRRRIPSRH